MDLSRPYAAVCPSLDGEVLHVLAGTEMALTGRQIAALTGRSSHSGVQRALDRLTEHGLVKRVELNFAFLYSLNREHLAFPAVDSMIGMRAALEQEIGCKLARWEIEPIHVSLFGSAARGDGDTSSDIDLLVVRPDQVPEADERWREQLADLESSIFRWTGNRASVIETSSTELKRPNAHAGPIVAELRSDAFTLWGFPIAALLGEG
jgi:predicted nucleotidyltransferase